MAKPARVNIAQYDDTNTHTHIRAYYNCIERSGRSSGISDIWSDRPGNMAGKGQKKKNTTNATYNVRVQRTNCGPKRRTEMSVVARRTQWELRGQTGGLEKHIRAPRRRQ